MIWYMGKTCWFNYDDPSKVVQISVKVNPDNFRLDDGTATITICGEDLIELIASYVRMSKISKLESSSAEELLGIK
jgi:hypothetical protein